jgi:membrane protease YdiL (CAAX protease family)
MPCACWDYSLFAQEFGGFSHGEIIAANQGLRWLAGMVLLGISEEYMFRGYALQSLWRSLGFWPAALITSGLFVAAHLSKPHENCDRAVLSGGLSVGMPDSTSANSF